MEIIPLKLSVTNCYLIKAGSKYILIDTGYEQDWDLFNQGLKRAGINSSDISHLILTHHHDDHCGMLNRFVKENPAVHVVLTETAAKLLKAGENDRTYHKGRLLNRRIKWLITFKRYLIMLKTGKTAAKENLMKFEPYYTRPADIIVRDHTFLKNIGIDLNGKIIETPGHTDDSISILLDDGSCFSGDAAANFLQFAGTKYCVIFITDMHEYYQSWKKILAEKPEVIYPSHGKPFPAEKLVKFIGKNK